MDAIMELIKEMNFPMTRQTYIELAFTSDDTDIENLTPEQLAQIPEELKD